MVHWVDKILLVSSLGYVQLESVLWEQRSQEFKFGLGFLGVHDGLCFGIPLWECMVSNSLCECINGNWCLDVLFGLDFQAMLDLMVEGSFQVLAFIRWDLVWVAWLLHNFIVFVSLLLLGCLSWLKESGTDWLVAHFMWFWCFSQSFKPRLFNLFLFSQFFLAFITEVMVLPLGWLLERKAQGFVVFHQFVCDADVAMFEAIEVLDCLAYVFLLEGFGLVKGSLCVLLCC